MLNLNVRQITDVPVPESVMGLINPTAADAVATALAADAAARSALIGFVNARQNARNAMDKLRDDPNRENRMYALSAVSDSKVARMSALISARAARDAAAVAMFHFS